MPSVKINRLAPILGFAAVAAVCAVINLKTADSAVPAAQEPVFNVLPLKPENITITSSYVGYVIPIKSVDLVPNVSGYIEDVWVEGGQEVRAGDNLLLIDQREYKAALNAAKAAVTKAQADFANAKAYYERIKKAGAKAISASEQDSAKAGYLSALAAVEQAKAEEAKAQVLYDYTVLQASIDGVVGNVSLTKGNYVAPAGSPLLSIVQYNPIRVVFALSDKEYLNAVSRQNGQPLFAGELIRLKLADGSLYQKTGEFKYIDNAQEKGTGSVAVYADFANSERKLMPDAYVDVLVERMVIGGYALRQNYVSLSPEGAFVYVANNHRLRKVQLKIIGEENGFYVVNNQFAQDDYLVIDKVGNIAPDATVKTKVAAENS